MAAGNLEPFFGLGGFSTDSDADQRSVEEQVKDAIRDFGWPAPPVVLIDGEVHRFPLKGKNDDVGWYRIYPDALVPAGYIGDWRQGGEGFSFRANIGRPISIAEEMAIKVRQEKAKKIRKEEQEEAWEEASKDAIALWNSCGSADSTTGYCAKKGLSGAYKTRVSASGSLIVPGFNEDGEISTIQTIPTNGKKMFFKNAKAGGCFYPIGELKEKVYIAEGFATAATIYEETGELSIMAFGAGNIPKVAKIMRNKYPDKSIIIVADNDSLKTNTGEKKAREAAEQSGCSVIMPPEPGDINDYRESGGDVKSLLFSSSLIKELDVSFIDELSEEYEPPDELIQNLLVKKTVSVVYGDSNSGKTFFCLSLARDVSEGWDCYGRKTEKGLVLYIATEAPGSIKMRLQAMKKHHNYHFKNIAVVKKPINLYQNQTDHIKIIELVTEVEKKRGQKVNFIIADTLAQISAGADENGVKDMSPIMQKFSLISEMTNTSVLVIHHSGKDKSKGARGSSSIYAHVNTEIKVSDNGKYKTAEITKERELGSKGDKINYKLEIIEMGLGKFKNKQSTCVAIHDTEEHKPELPTKIIEDMQYLEGAWLCSGMEHDENSNFPYITSSAWKTFLVDNGIVKNENAGSQAVKKSGKGMATRFIEKNIIRPFNNGYLIIEDEFSTKLMLCRKSRI